MKEKKKLQLSLNKRKISELTNSQSKKIEGGATYGYNCDVVSIDVACWSAGPGNCRTDFPNWRC